MDETQYANGITAANRRLFLGFWKLGSGGGLITGFTALYRKFELVSNVLDGTILACREKRKG